MVNLDRFVYARRVRQFVDVHSIVVPYPFSVLVGEIFSDGRAYNDDMLEIF